MSGHKVATVTISQEEYQKLYQAERDLRYSLNDLKLEDVETLADDRQSIFDQLLDFNKRKLGQYSSFILSTNTDNNIEVENLRKMYEYQINELEQIINRQTQNLNEMNNQGINEVQNLTNQILELRSKLTFVDSQLTDQRTKSKLATDSLEYEFNNSLEEVGTYIEQIKQYQQHPLFQKARFDNIQNCFETALNNEMNGFSDAALSMIQIVLLDAKDYQRKLDLDQSMIFFLTSEFLVEIKALKQSITRQSIIEAVTREGQPSGVFIDLNEWSDGKYNAILVDLDNLEIWLKSNYEILTFDDLQEFEKSLRQLEINFAEVIHSSRINVINSQLKYEVANQVLLALIAQGYVPLGGDFCDYQGAERYFATAKNGEGNIVTILIDNPEVNAIGSKLSILSSDFYQRTQNELIHRATEIKEAVSRYGLEVGDLTEVPIRHEKVTASVKTRESNRLNSNG